MRQLFTLLTRAAPTEAAHPGQRRDRHRQGGVRRGDPRAQRPRAAGRSSSSTAPAVPRVAHRERAVRPRARRLHRRGRRARRRLRAGARRHPVHRRDRRAAARAAAAPVARASTGSRSSRSALRAIARSTCAWSRRRTAICATRSRTGASARTSTIASRWCRCACRLAHAQGGHPGAGQGAPRRRRPVGVAGGAGASDRARVAGQRARAAQRARARALVLPKGGATLTPTELGFDGAAVDETREGFHAAKDRLIATWERGWVTELLKRAKGNVSQAARARPARPRVVASAHEEARHHRA